MVVLSAAVTTKGGKSLLSRQYVDMSHVRVEGLMAAFPKLMSSETSSDKEHTYIETEAVRYVYHPLSGGLYLLLVTNKGSNIIEDLDTLQLLAKVVPELCGGGPGGPGVSEESVVMSAYELFFAMDEVLTYGGYREAITLPQIRTNMEMESHEEKLAILIRISKMNEAKEEAKRKATAMREARREMARSGMGRSDMPSGGMGGFGGGSSSGGGGGGYDRDRERPAARPARVVEEARPAAGGGGGGGGMKPGKRLGKGLKLGKGGGSRDAGMAAMMREEGIADSPAAGGAGGGAGAGDAGPAAGAGAGAGAGAADVPTTDISCSAAEKLTVAMGRDGGLEQMEVKGSLTLQVNREGAGCARLELNPLPASSGFKFQSHPNVSKPRFTADSVLEAKDPSNPFPVGTGVGVLRWRGAFTDETRVPLVVNCWPEEEGSAVKVNIEYTLQRTDMELNDVVIAVPLGTTHAPTIAMCDGTYKHSSKEQSLVWSIDMVDHSNKSGTLEFTVPGDDPDVFFPLALSFTSRNLLCPVAVAAAINVADNTPLSVTSSSLMEVASYSVNPE